LALVGSFALVLALIGALYGVIAGIRDAQGSSRPFALGVDRALWAVAVLVTLASAILLYLLLARDFRVVYVYQYVSTHLPAVYTISAFWAGQEGSLLLWLWFVAILAALLTRNHAVPERVRPYLLAVLALVEAFFVLTIIVTSNPFATHAVKPAEGVGMLPLLENPGMVVHPPVLFLGYAGYTLPFAFAMAALLSGQLDRKWIRAVRPWSLLAWLALSCGILIGAWWSYVELGWGGYWAWDPVENASLVPWLLGTALLHSLIVEERRGLQRGWNVVLPTLAFLACLFATLVTRGGIIVSDLHGFASAIQPVAYFLLVAIAVGLLSGLGLVYRRRRQLVGAREVKSFLSRESHFLLVSLFLSGAAFTVLLGTTFPTLARLLQGTLVSMNTSFYNRAVGPLLAVVILLMGICPVVGWERFSPRSVRYLMVQSGAALVVTVTAWILGVREVFPLLSMAVCFFVLFSLMGTLTRELIARRRSTGENLARALMNLLSKARRRYGAYMVHLAIVLIAIGITGSTAYKRQQLVALSRGESTNLAGYSIRFEDLAMDTLNPEPVTYQSKLRFAATLGVYRGESKLRTLVAEKSYHWALENPWVTEVAIYSNLKEDLYIILADLDQTGLASFEIVLNPLVNWIWIGGGVLLLGTLVAAWPEKRVAAVDA
jgi:cytochrome c-type biogenesis protein CcmF